MKRDFQNQVRRSRLRGGLLAGFAFVLASSASSMAMAQCVTTQTVPPGGTTISNLEQLAVPAASAAASISGAIGNVNTAFLTQQGSAFVSAPANPAPNQPGGGVWVRGVGGEADLRNSSNSTIVTTTTPGGVAVNNANVSCANSQHVSFGGVQVGADIARLNWNEWNIHIGSTAGYLGSKSTDNNAFSNKFDIPFFGTYLVATKGRFFADLMYRQDFYNIELNNPGATFFNRPVGAHGYSISGSVGYNFALQNNWFIEPSAGFIYSKTKVDDFTNPGTPTLQIGGTISTRDIESQLGRATVRVGTTIATPNIVWQPFASASVFHEFAGDVSSTYSTLPNNAFLGGFGAINVNQTTTVSRIGTYGQYSIGVAGQLVNTGWLGFVRGDYRNGSNIEGWSGNAGLRYQFAPDAVASAMPVKVKAPVPYLAPTNWTGFYVGGFLGGVYGRTDIGFVGSTEGAKPYVLGPQGGGQIGYNYQFPSNWVIGVEGSIGASAIKGARTAGFANGLDATGTPIAGPAGFSPAYMTLRDRTDWMATATARVGYSYGRTLYYVRGGGAWENSKVSAVCELGPTGVSPDGIRVCRNQAGAITGGFNTGDKTRTGWLIGFGTEFDLGKGWSAKTDYNYISFGRNTNLASDGTTLLTSKSEIFQATVGVNYRWGGAPLVAKY